MIKYHNLCTDNWKYGYVLIPFLRKLPRATTNVQKNKSYVGLFISYVGLFISYVGLIKSYVGLIKSYVGLYKSYVGDKKSYVGDKKSYVGDKKSYVGLIFLHICYGPRKLPYFLMKSHLVEWKIILPTEYHKVYNIRLFWIFKYIFNLRTRSRYCCRIVPWNFKLHTIFWHCDIRTRLWNLQLEALVLCNVVNVVPYTIFKCDFCEITVRKMLQDCADTKSALVQMMAWCSQPTRHYPRKYWPSLMVQYGANVNVLLWR